jgi:hypothetical protein
MNPEQSSTPIHPPAGLTAPSARVIFVEPRSGQACPRCSQGKLDYNGLLELECPLCGYVISGGAGCT